jgi:hypothetical protein
MPARGERAGSPSLSTGEAAMKRLLLFLVALGACSSGVKGTYTNTGGMVMLELAGGNKATFSLGGDTRECTYSADDKAVTLTCGRDRTSFRINADGTLMGPGFIGVMKKSKS